MYTYVHHLLLPRVPPLVKETKKTFADENRTRAQCFFFSVKRGARSVIFWSDSNGFSLTTLSITSISTTRYIVYSLLKRKRRPQSCLEIFTALERNFRVKFCFLSFFSAPRPSTVTLPTLAIGSSLAVPGNSVRLLERSGVRSPSMLWSWKNLSQGRPPPLPPHLASHRLKNPFAGHLSPRRYNPPAPRPPRAFCHHLLTAHRAPEQRSS